MPRFSLWVFSLKRQKIDILYIFYKKSAKDSNFENYDEGERKRQYALEFH